MVLLKDFDQMELIALLAGLKIVEEQKLLPIEINIDSVQVITMLKNGNLHYDSIIDLCRSTLRKIGNPPVLHCYRVQNHVADALAKHGATKGLFEQINHLAVPPVYALKHMWSDTLGTTFVRKLNHHPNDDEETYFCYEPD